MRPISAFASLMPDTVTIAAASSRDAYGEITYGSATTYRARVVGEQKLIRGFTGEEVLSRHTVYVMGAAVVQPEAQVTLSTGLVNSTDASAIHPPILGAGRVPDQSGTHHAVLYLG